MEEMTFRQKLEAEAIERDHNAQREKFRARRKRLRRWNTVGVITWAIALATLLALAAEQLYGK